MRYFVGRKRELQQLRELQYLKRAVLVTVKGRRRIGKSSLIAEFAKNMRILNFSGIAPIESVSAQDQRNIFAMQLAAQVKMRPDNSDDWSQTLSYLTSHLDQSPTVILFDEISWMGSKDTTFIPKLKIWWDLELQKYHNLILVFCGSVSTWIEENIINSTSFFGRITLNIDLMPLSLQESAQLLKLRGFKGSSYEIYKILSLTGGVPWYLEQISPIYMADHNIKQLCFEPTSILLHEFNSIFHDLFNGKGKPYREILELLKNGMKTLSEIRISLNYPASGTLSKIIEHLIICGFVSKHNQWSLSRQNSGKQSLYRINDPYIRFYLKYIEPAKTKIMRGFYRDLDIAQLPEFDVVMGFQVESLLLQNRTILLKALDINPIECSFDNPYIQKSTLRTKGMQIDYLIQTRNRNIFLCEFKFKKRSIGTEVIEETKEKMARLATPRGFSVVPVLFYLGDLSEAVIDQNFFYRHIDIAGFIEN